MFCEWCVKENIEFKVVRFDSPEKKFNHQPSRTDWYSEGLVPDVHHIPICKECGSPAIFLSEHHFISEVERHNAIAIHNLEEKLRKGKKESKERECSPC